MCSMPKSIGSSKSAKTINVSVPDITKPDECRLLIENSIKFILFSRKVIPYPYSHLYDVVKQTASDKSMTAREANFAQIHVKKASTIITRVDSILKGLEKEFSNATKMQIREVALLIGPTIQCAKEAYIFKIPNTFPGKECTKPARKDHMRHVVINPDITTFISKSIQVTNMYVIVKKPEGDTSTWICPTPNYEIPKRVPVAIVDMRTKYEETQMTNLAEDTIHVDVSNPCVNNTEEQRSRKKSWTSLEYQTIVNLLPSTSLCTSEQGTEDSAVHSDVLDPCMDNTNEGNNKNRKINLMELECQKAIDLLQNASLHASEQVVEESTITSHVSDSCISYTNEGHKSRESLDAQECQETCDSSQASLHVDELVIGDSAQECFDTSKFNSQYRGMSQDLSIQNMQNTYSSRTDGACADTYEATINRFVSKYEKQINKSKEEGAKTEESVKDVHKQEIMTASTNNKIIWYLASEYLPGFKQPVVNYTKNKCNKK